MIEVDSPPVLPARRGMSLRAGTGLSRALTIFLLLLCAVVALMPLVWLVAATTKGPDDLFHYTFFAPRFSAQNYQDLFTKVPFLRYLINSVYVTGAKKV